MKETVFLIMSKSMTDPCILTTLALRLIEKTSSVQSRKFLIAFVTFVGNSNFKGVPLN